MNDYVLLHPLDVTEGRKKTTKPAGTVVSLSPELAKWLDECGVISISGEAPAPAVMRRQVRTQPTPRKRCCGW